MPVGSFDCPECPFGLFDMSGNVWEWTRSPYQSYPYDPTDDRENLEIDALWVMRGGSFADPARNVRAAIRGGGDPGVRRPFMGFRLVLSGLIVRTNPPQRSSTCQAKGRPYPDSRPSSLSYKIAQPHRDQASSS